MQPSTPASSRPRGRLRRSLGYLRPFRGSVAGILLLVLTAGVLNAQDGYYASLVRRQTRGLLPDTQLLPEPGLRKVSGAA